MQTLSLMSTIISVHPKIILQELKNLQEPLVLTMLLYGIKGFELEKIFLEDKNHFLVDFLEEDEDYESQISIRNTITDFLEDIICRLEFDK